MTGAEHIRRGSIRLKTPTRRLAPRAGAAAMPSFDMRTVTGQQQWSATAVSRLIDEIDQIADGVHANGVQPDFDASRWNSWTVNHPRLYWQELRKRGRSIRSGYSHKKDDPEWGYGEKLTSANWWRGCIEKELQRSNPELRQEFDAVRSDNYPRKDIKTNEELNRYLSALLEWLESKGLCN